MPWVYGHAVGLWWMPWVYGGCRGSMGMPWVYVYINALWNRIDDAPNAL
jgi:hypothetical protein